MKIVIIPRTKMFFVKMSFKGLGNTYKIMSTVFTGMHSEVMTEFGLNYKVIALGATVASVYTKSRKQSFH
jgi:hypothetical protein